MMDFQGKIRLVYKDFPLASHAGAEPAAQAARCAGERGQFWEYHDLLFVSQPAFSRADLLGYASRLGIQAEPFTACLDSGQFRDAVKTDMQEGRAAGVTGTPTFLINGRRFVGAQPLAAFREAVQEALKDAETRRR